MGENRNMLRNTPSVVYFRSDRKDAACEKTMLDCARELFKYGEGFSDEQLHGLAEVLSSTPANIMDVAREMAGALKRIHGGYVAAKDRPQSLTERMVEDALARAHEAGIEVTE